MIGYAGIFFDWDDEKEIANKKKHGISFEEAISARKATRQERQKYEHGG